MSTVIATRPVRIFFAMEEGPLSRAIKQTLPTDGNEDKLAYVDQIEGADLIIFTNVREVEAGYSPDKAYAFLQADALHTQGKLPENCTTVGIRNVLGQLAGLISELQPKLKPLDAAPAAPEAVEVPLLPDALNILVIDDTPTNIESAKRGLAGHRLTTATGYREAMELLGGVNSFQVALIDLHLPMSSRTMGDKFELGKLVPYGILLMIEAARQGVGLVAVVTDLSHHDDPFSAAFDHYSRYSVSIEGAAVVMMHAPMSGGAKDWAEALRRLQGDACE